MSSGSSTNKNVKIAGAVMSAVALVVVGVVLLGHTDDREQNMYPLGRAQAIAKFENANVPLSQLPTESQVHVPAGWQVESDKPFGPGEAQDDDEDDLVLEPKPIAEDDDIDSPLEVEEDENGQNFVAEMDDDVIAFETESEGQEAVATDRIQLKCFGGLKKCGYRKRCQRVCKKKCKPYTKRVCKAKKYCKCFCKFFKNIKKARRCVVYKRQTCKKVLKYRCRRHCRKFCQQAPRCYCCARRHIRRACRTLCRRINYKTKCGKCRCFRVKCYKYCTFVCKRYN